MRPIVAEAVTVHKSKQTNQQSEEGHSGKWVTVRENRIFIWADESVEDAFTQKKDKVAKKESKTGGQ